MQKLHVQATDLRVDDVLEIAGTKSRITYLTLDFGRGPRKVRIHLRDLKNGFPHFTQLNVNAKKYFDIKRPKKK